MNLDKIILFDGRCNLCSSSVQFIIRHDSKKKFRFASLQSDIGQRLLVGQLGVSQGGVDSVVLIDSGKVYTKSDAALQIVKQLDGAWKVLFVLRIVPRGLRDCLYKWVAKNRYRWFGKSESCMVPNSDLKELFLD